MVDSRDLDEAAMIRRRRECAACGTRFTTYERIESARLGVVKRDGRREEFERQKLVAGLEKALTRRPVEAGAALRAAEEIEAELRAEGLSEVPSTRIGQMALERLLRLDRVAYIRFASVHRDFDVEQLKREVDTVYGQGAARSPGDAQLALDLPGVDARAAASAGRGSRRHVRR